MTSPNGQTRRVTLQRRHPDDPPPFEAEVTAHAGALSVRIGGATIPLDLTGDRARGWCRWEGRVLPYVAGWVGRDLHIWIAGEQFVFTRPEQSSTRARGAQGALGRTVTAPMPGKVLRVLVRPGDAVEAGQPLVVMESMKMEQTLVASSAGRVVRVHVAEGATVRARAVLVEMGPLGT